MKVRRKTDGKVFEVMALDCQIEGTAQGARLTPDQVEIVPDETPTTPQPEINPQ